MLAARVRRRGVSCAGEAAGGVDEALEQRRVLGAVRQQLGVPLHAQAEARGRVPQRLDGAVGRPRADLEAGADAVGGLVMEGVDREAVGAGQPVQERAAVDVDVVRRREPLVALEVRRASLRSGRCWCSVPPRETLSACSPRQMPSSGRSRSAAPASSASSYSSETRSTSGPSAGWRLLAVDGRVEVGAAAHEQAVEAVEQRARVVDVAVGRQHDRDRRPPPAAPGCRTAASRAAAATRSRSLRPGAIAQPGVSSASSSCVTTPISGGAAERGTATGRGRERDIVRHSMRSRGRGRPACSPASGRAACPSRAGGARPTAPAVSRRPARTGRAGSPRPRRGRCR